MLSRQQKGRRGCAASAGPADTRAALFLSPQPQAREQRTPPYPMWGPNPSTEPPNRHETALKAGASPPCGRTRTWNACAPGTARLGQRAACTRLFPARRRELRRPSLRAVAPDMRGAADCGAARGLADPLLGEDDLCGASPARNERATSAQRAPTAPLPQTAMCVCVCARGRRPRERPTPNTEQRPNRSTVSPRLPPSDRHRPWGRRCSRDRWDRRCPWHRRVAAATPRAVGMLRAPCSSPHGAFNRRASGGKRYRMIPNLGCGTPYGLAAVLTINALLPWRAAAMVR